MQANERMTTDYMIEFTSNVKRSPYGTPLLMRFGSLASATLQTTGTIQEGGMMTMDTGVAGCMGQIPGVMERPCP